MTITKNSTYYLISGDVNNVDISGSASVYESGGVAININLANGISADFTKNADGTKNLGVSYPNNDSDVDFVQQIVGNVLGEVAPTPSQTQD